MAEEAGRHVGVGQGMSVRRLVVRRGPALWCVDSAIWASSLIIATALRYEFELPVVPAGRTFLFMAASAVVLALVGSWTGLYVGRWRPGGVEDATAAGVTVCVLVAAAMTLDLAAARPLPLAAPVAAGPLALVGMVVVRLVLRLNAEQLEPPSPDASRVIVFGAGDGADSLLAAMRRSRHCPYVPVALLDDDPAKSRLRLRGVTVQGDRSSISEVARRTGADTLLIAIPSAPATLIRELAGIAAKAGVAVRVLPRVSELFDGRVGVEDIRPISYSDLLGRHEVQIDLASVASYITGRRVLVTGAGGSIGSELCRQVHRLAPAALVMVDRDESALHAVELSLTGRALLQDPGLVVADIRDRLRISDVVREHRPDVLFHAAALKHLPMLEMHPDEAVKTNVWGTWNVLEAAAAHGVSTFVNISTDKAADPTSVLGHTKRMAERLTAWYASRQPGTFLSVRFGNVLGSRGSVLTTFEAQIARGGPVTVTDPCVTRYFMTIEEAVRLVVQAGAIGSDGEALVLDMGEPVRIDDVASRLIDESGSPAQIQYTGLRAGEKLHEVLLARDEIDWRPFHPLISHVPVPPLTPATVRGVDLRRSPADIIEWCEQMTGSRPAADGPAGPPVATSTRPAVPLSRSRRVSDPIAPATES